MKKLLTLKWHEFLLIISLVLIHSFSHAQEKDKGGHAQLHFSFSK